MVPNWRNITLGNFVSLQRGHDLTEDERRPGHVPVMGSAGMNGYHDIAKAKGPGVVIGRSGASFGQVHYCLDDYWPHNTALYVTDFQGNDPRFAYYFLKSLDFSRYNSGSAQPSLNRNFIAPIEICVPEPNEQRIIADVVGALDDKIELNRRMNETLGALAQSLFKSLFIDFEAIRAKGGHFEDSPLGKIPRGWKVSTLKALTTKIGSGATPRGGSAVYVDEGVALIRSQNVHDHEFHWDGLARLTEKAAAELEGVEVKPEDILFNITGDSILRTCVVEPEVLPARVNQHVAIIRAKSNIPARFLHLFLVQPRMKYFLSGLDSGATRRAVTKGQLEALEVLHPPDEVLAKFAELTNPIFSRITVNRSESRTLAALRDTLLPKLLSGELRVPTE